MGIDIGQYKKYVVMPTLVVLARWLPQLNSPAAINLLTGTAIVESELQYIYQVPNGPAIGVLQMEPATLEDQFNTFLDYGYNAGLKAAVMSLAVPALTLEENLYGNMFFGVGVARIKYYRSPMPLPVATDAEGLADYHKICFNTALGAADVIANVPKFQTAIDV